MNAPQPSTGETRTAPERLLKVTKLSKPSSRRVLAALIGGAPAARDRQPMGWSRRVSLRRAAAVGVECFTVVGLVGERRLRSLDGTMVGRQEAGGNALAERLCRGERRGGEGRAVLVRRSPSWCPSFCCGNRGRVGEARGNGAGTCLSAIPAPSRTFPCEPESPFGVALAAAGGEGKRRERGSRGRCLSSFSVFVLRMGMG